MIVFASMVSAFLLAVPMPYTIGIRYHIKNEALIGACLLPSGIGSMVGATIVGRISDQTVIKWRRKRKGLWYPEDRLRAALIPFAIIVPISVLTFGLVNKFVDGNLGLALCLVCLFLTGVGVDMTFGACVAYLVDVMHSRSSEILATIDVLCSSLIALSVAAFLPMINNHGIAITNGMCAILIWITFGGLCCIIKYGDQMRAWMDIGFSTDENN
jgi:MFS family permease